MFLEMFFHKKNKFAISEFLLYFYHTNYKFEQNSTTNHNGKESRIMIEHIQRIQQLSERSLLMYSRSKSLNTNNSEW